MNVCPFTNSIGVRWFWDWQQ